MGGNSGLQASLSLSLSTYILNEGQRKSRCYHRVIILINDIHSRRWTIPSRGLLCLFSLNWLKLIVSYKNTRCATQRLSRTNGITLGAIIFFFLAVYEIFQTERVSTLPSVLCFTMFPRRTCANKQTQKQVRSLASTWKRGTSNPAVFSYARLSRAAGRRRQTKPWSRVDANESRRRGFRSAVCLREAPEVRCERAA